LISAGEALAATLPPPTAAQRQGGLARLCGQLAQVRGDAEAVVAAWAAALEHYDRAGPALYAANRRYMLGALALNRANEELQPAFGHAEERLRSTGHRPRWQVARTARLPGLPGRRRLLGGVTCRMVI